MVNSSYQAARCSRTTSPYPLAPLLQLVDPLPEAQLQSCTFPVCEHIAKPRLVPLKPCVARVGLPFRTTRHAVLCRFGSVTVLGTVSASEGIRCATPSNPPGYVEVAYSVNLQDFFFTGPTPDILIR